MINDKNLDLNLFLIHNLSKFLLNEGKNMKTLGGTALNKGIINNIQLVMWDAVPECNEDCPIYDTCIYAANHHNKCDLRKQYTNKVLQNLETACTEEDKIKIHKIG